MVGQHLQAEDVPAAVVVTDELRRDGDAFGEGGGAAAGGEHEDALAGGKQGPGVASAEAVDIGPIVLVRQQRERPLEVVGRADAAQVVPVAEVAVGS